MTPLRQRMIEDMQLRGLSEVTQEKYVTAVRQLAAYYGKAPDQLSQTDLRQYLLYLKNEKQVSPSAYKVALYGLKFFYLYTLQHQWSVLELVKPPRQTRLPVVLSREEVRQVLGCLRQPHYRVCLSTIYACGLRLQEGVRLQVRDIDSQRMVIHVRQGKRNQDRYVPLPERTLVQLRGQWCQHRHPVWLFPGRHENTDPEPMDKSGVQRAFRAALKQSGLKKAATVHTLRHSYATHLLEAGVNLRLIQSYLGHRSLVSTAIYTHITPASEATAKQVINRLMADLP